MVPSPAEERPDVSVVIPVYKSQGTLPALLPRLESVLRSRQEPFEVLLVNDNGLDEAWAMIEDWASTRPWVRGMCLMRNYGQHNALLCGIRAARGSRIVTIDDDLQHPPEEIPKLLAKLEEGYDVVYGAAQSQRHGLWRNLASQVTKLVLRGAMGTETACQVSAFRVFRSTVEGAFRNYSGPFVCLDVLLTWGTTRFAAVPTRHEERYAGKSNYTFGKLVVHAMNMITGFSVMPLKLASLAGFLCTIFGLAVLGYVWGRYLIGGVSVPGFTFLASTITIFSGAQLFALGIIGEYLARMHFRAMERPTYVVCQATFAGKDPHGRC